MTHGTEQPHDLGSEDKTATEVLGALVARELLTWGFIQEISDRAAAARKIGDQGQAVEVLDGDSTTVAAEIIVDTHFTVITYDGDAPVEAHAFKLAEVDAAVELAQPPQA